MSSSSSESSLMTTAASDTSSSADSKYYYARGTTSCSRRRSYNLKARGVVITKGDQRVLCVCKGCKGQRLVSKSTCYRHLRAEAELATTPVGASILTQHDHVKRWIAPSPAQASLHLQALRVYSLLHLAGIRFCYGGNGITRS